MGSQKKSLNNNGNVNSAFHDETLGDKSNMHRFLAAAATDCTPFVLRRYFSFPVSNELELSGLIGRVLKRPGEILHLFRVAEKKNTINNIINYTIQSCL